MNKIFYIFYLGLISLFALCSCDDTQSPSPLKIIAKTHGEIFTVGFECGYKPHGFSDPETNEYVGYDLDLAREVCRRNSWKLELRPLDWNNKEKEVDSGNVDCIWNGFKMTGREDKFTWSKPYLESLQVVISLKKFPIKKLAGLAGKRVAIQSTTPTFDEFKRGKLRILANTFQELVVVSDFVELIDQLNNYEVDAIITDFNVIKHLVSSEHCNYYIMPQPLIHTQDGVAFKKGNTALRDQVQSTLDDMVRDGTMARITEKWFGRDISILRP